MNLGKLDETSIYSATVSATTCAPCHSFGMLFTIATARYYYTFLCKCCNIFLHFGKK